MKLKKEHIPRMLEDAEKLMAAFIKKEGGENNALYEHVVAIHNKCLRYQDNPESWDAGVPMAVTLTNYIKLFLKEK